jgi:hypothetical protein
MADFRTHITASTVIGIGYGTASHLLLGIPVPHCIIAAGLCSVAGMLPDLDSDSGIPVRETLCFVSVLIPMLMLRRFQAMGLGPEQIVMVSAFLYVGLRFGVGALFKRYTKHRGMWHSIPAALIAALATYLVCLSPDVQVRLLKSCAVFVGFVTHLVLDEIYSVDLYGRRIKKSFGTALKFFGRSRWANFSTYAKLAALVVIALGDARFMELFDAEPLNLQATGAKTVEWVGDLVPIFEDPTTAR